jgi:hypothetical protein
VIKMAQEERDFVVLRTYEHVWNTPFKIYSIENIKLWFPINPWDLLYIGGGVLLSFVLERVLPLYGYLPFIIKYIVIPYLFKLFLSKVKLDGKKPHKFFFDYIVYMVSSKEFERFQGTNEKNKIRFTTPVTFRRYEPDPVLLVDPLPEGLSSEQIKELTAARTQAAVVAEKERKKKARRKGGRIYYV